MNKLNQYIDHTLLSVTASIKNYELLCQQAIDNNFFSVCIPPYFVKLASNLLRNTSVKVCSVIGFPSGLTTLKNKASESSELLHNGADEIDMVANLTLIKSHQWPLLFEEVKHIKSVCHNNILKVIVESSLLTKDEILNCCLVLKDAGADFIKTSTGFNGPGANIDDVVYMNKILQNTDLKIKASGGIKTSTQMQSFINAGCKRIGTSSGVKIMNQLKSGVQNENSSSSNY